MDNKLKIVNDIKLTRKLQKDIELYKILKSVYDIDYDKDIDNITENMYCYEHMYDDIGEAIGSELKKYHTIIKKQIEKDFNEILKLNTTVEFQFMDMDCPEAIIKISTDEEGLNHFEDEVLSIMRNYGLMWYDCKEDYLEVNEVQENDLEGRLDYASEHLHWFKYYEKIYHTNKYFIMNFE